MRSRDSCRRKAIIDNGAVPAKLPLANFDTAPSLARNGKGFPMRTSNLTLPGPTLPSPYGLTAKPKMAKVLCLTRITLLVCTRERVPGNEMPIILRENGRLAPLLSVHCALLWVINDPANDLVPPKRAWLQSPAFLSFILVLSPLSFLHLCSKALRLLDCTSNLRSFSQSTRAYHHRFTLSAGTRSVHSGIRRIISEYNSSIKYNQGLYNRQ